EEAERAHGRAHPVHPVLPAGGRRRLRRARVRGGARPPAPAGPEARRVPQEVRLLGRGLPRAGAPGAAGRAAPRRPPVEVRRLLLLRHHRDHHHRVRPRRARHGLRQGLLHVLCAPGHPPDAGHLPEPGRAPERAGAAPPAGGQALPGAAAATRVHREHGSGRAAGMRHHPGPRGRRLRALRGLDLLPRLLLLLHHPHHHRLRRLRGAAERRGAAEEAALRGFQLPLHPPGAHGHRRLPQPRGPALPGGQHR
ncbi:unnamed protein product, partial [Gulo gulo]